MTEEAYIDQGRDDISTHECRHKPGMVYTVFMLMMVPFYT